MANDVCDMAYKFFHSGKHSGLFWKGMPGLIFNSNNILLIQLFT